MTHDLGRLDVPATQTLASLGDDEPVPFALTDTALAVLDRDDRFGHIFRTYQRRIQAYILPQLRHHDHELAADLTQETLLLALRDLHTARADDDHLFSWLATIAKRTVAGHYRLARHAREEAADFADPENVTARTAAAPASTLPHLAGMFADLERAKEQLTEVAEQYKTATRALAKARTGLRFARRPEATARNAAHVINLSRQSAAALADFQAAANHVAQLRTAWNQAADNTPVTAPAADSPRPPRKPRPKPKPLLPRPGQPRPPSPDSAAPMVCPECASILSPGHACKPRLAGVAR